MKKPPQAWLGRCQPQKRWRCGGEPRRPPLLLPLLEKPGLQLAETGGGNFQLAAFPGLIVKDSYWRWPEHELGGDAIDFLVQVLGCSFHDAMRELNPPPA